MPMHLRDDLRIRARQPSSWLIIGIAALLAIGSLRDTIDTLFAARNPALASRLIDSPRAEVKLWTLKTLSTPTQKPDPAIVALAREAIARNPMEVQAVRSLSLYYSLTGKPSDSRRLASLAQSMTRRDQLAQILLASDLASAGNTTGAMGHLARALTVTNQGRQEIFNVMLPMLQHEGATRSFAPLVSSGRPWLSEFFDFAIRKNPENSRVVADIIVATEPARARWAIRKTGSLLLSTLAENGDVDRLRRLVSRGDSDLQLLVGDWGLNARTASPDSGWLAWTPVQDGANGAQLGATESGGFGILAYAGPGEQERPLLRRAMLLPPGRYALTDQRQQVNGDETARLFWSISCHAQSGWRELSRSGGSALRDRVEFAVDANCPLQMVQLLGTTTRGGDGAQVLIDGVRITAR